MNSNSDLNYPDLPVSRERETILEAMVNHQVVVVVGDTGSGKTTQLPKMALEFARRNQTGRGRVGCTQPRRIAAASVAQRVAEEMGSEIGKKVGYQVRFEERVSPDTCLKFMTDGILLAETQGDPNLKQYHSLIIDEAHERSLNIDFLLGYLKRLLPRRPDLKVLISSATLDAGGFSEFYDNCPIVEVEGRTFPVEVEYLPPRESEYLARHVDRAVEEISRYDGNGDILVFLPGEREIRDCADQLEGKKYPSTDICPLFARLGLGDQQAVFRPNPRRRRIVLATNVAETSLTIPGIVYVIDSGLARVSRWNPGRQVQRLQVEPISQASARQRKGRCGRVSEGICVRLYPEEDFSSRPEFTDPEIRRSSLAGVILRMKSLGLPEISEFPFIDPPKTGNITEGYRTLREIEALDKEKDLTRTGRSLAKLPVEPRLGRMLLAASEKQCLGEVLVIVAGLTVMDPRERPAEKQEAADKAHQQWADEDSDFLTLLHLWDALADFRDNRRWQKNQLRKFCRENFLNFRRVLEWDNLRNELGQLGKKQLKWQWKDFDGHQIETGEYRSIHESIMSGVPRQFGLLDPESKDYKGANGGKFAIFPGSGLFGKKKPDWLLAYEMVDTTRLWARRVARIDPAWVEEVAPHLCRSRYHSAYWNRKQGAVYAKEIVVCGGLNIIVDRRLHYGRIYPEASREIFIRDGLLGGGLIKQPAFLKRIGQLREEVTRIEEKTRRSGGLWHEDTVFDFLDRRIPEDMCTAKAFHRWLRNEDDAGSLIPTLEDLMHEDLDDDLAESYPDELIIGGESFPLHYRHAPGEADDGITIEVALSQLHQFPDWKLSWGVPGILEERVNHLIRSLPKEIRIACQPISDTTGQFVEQWQGWEPEVSLSDALGDFLEEKTGRELDPSQFDPDSLPEHSMIKIWVYDDDSGEEIVLGTNLAELKTELRAKAEARFDRVVGAEWLMEGHTSWEFPDLPESVESGGRNGFPGLTDEGSSVGLRLSLDRESSAESHLRGCGRLFLLGNRDLKTYLEKNLPLKLETRMMLPLIGESGVSNDEFSLVSAMELFRSSPPRTAADFAQAAREGRAHFHETAERIGRQIDLVVDDYCEISRFLEKNRDTEDLGESVDDIDQQIRWLLRSNFLVRSSDRLSDYPRYFKAIRERIQRFGSHPLIRDLEKMDRIMPFLDDWEDQLEENGESRRLRDLRFAIEELRISLFAPGTPTGMKISEQRLASLFEV